MCYRRILRVRSDGKDFEYEGHDSFLRMPPAPELRVRRIHSLVTSPRLYLREAFLNMFFVLHYWYFCG